MGEKTRLVIRYYLKLDKQQQKEVADVVQQNDKGILTKISRKVTLIPGRPGAVSVLGAGGND